MKLKVTPEGVIIPKEFLEGFDEVEVSKKNGFILVIPTVKRDPVLELGKHPVVCGVSDASESHDKYLYGTAL
jgi:hypothetical protein